MEILSISIDSESLGKLDSVQKRLGFKSRSKLLRTAILSLLKDYETLESLSGNVESVFVLTYPETKKNNVFDMLHQFDSDIKTEMHHHHSNTGIDIIKLETTAENTRRFFNESKRNRSITSVVYSIVSSSNA